MIIGPYTVIGKYIIEPYTVAIPLINGTNNWIIPYSIYPLLI